MKVIHKCSKIISYNVPKVTERKKNVLKFLMTRFSLSSAFEGQFLLLFKIFKFPWKNVCNGAFLNKYHIMSMLYMNI